MLEHFDYLIRYNPQYLSWRSVQTENESQNNVETAAKGSERKLKQSHLVVQQLHG